MTDEELIYRVSQADREAFNMFYLRFERKVFGTAYHYLQDREDAEETAQDIFVEVFRSARNYNGKASVNTWLYRIAVNKSLDKLRYRKARKRLGFVVSLFSHKEAADAVPDATADHGDIAEQSRLLHKLIAGLPENQKTALILTQLEELSIKETAAIMGTTPKAVESLTQRAKANMKNHLPKDHR